MKNVKPQTSRRVALIVEDEPLLNEAYSIILKKEGFEVHTAFDGKEALKIVASTTPDIILLDLRMPRMNGIEFLREYKNDKNRKKSHIIVFSNLDAQDEVDEAYELGAERYMLKAWASPKDLIQLVNDTLSVDSVKVV